MAITYTIGAKAASGAVQWPAGYQNNDIFIAFVNTGSAPPAGWTLLFTGHTGIWWLRVSGVPTTISYPNTSQVLSLRGCVTAGSPVDVMGVNNPTGNTAASITTPTNGSFILFFPRCSADDFEGSVATCSIADIATVNGGNSLFKMDHGTPGPSSSAFLRALFGGGVKAVAGAVGAASVAMSADGFDGTSMGAIQCAFRDANPPAAPTGGGAVVCIL